MRQVLPGQRLPLCRDRVWTGVLLRQRDPDVAARRAGDRLPGLVDDHLSEEHQAVLWSSGSDESLVQSGYLLVMGAGVFADGDGLWYNVEQAFPLGLVDRNTMQR